MAIGCRKFSIPYFYTMPKALSSHTDHNTINHPPIGSGSAGTLLALSILAAATISNFCAIRGQGARTGDLSMQVQEIMTAAVECCTPNEKAQRAAEIMREADTGVIPVLAGENDPKVVGIITDRDLCMAIVAAGRDPREVRVQECMTDQVVTLGPDDDIRHAADVMTEKQVRRLPVVDHNGAILGIVSLADIAQRQESPSQTGKALQGISEPSQEASASRTNGDTK
jgi:CBS domain-containing protein